MSAVPEMPWGIKAARMTETAELVTRAAALTAHGRELFIGTLAGYTDPIVRRAVLAALGGAEAGQGLAEVPDEPPWTIWCGDGTGQWTEVDHCEPAYAEAHAALFSERAQRDGLSLRYLALPEGQRPDHDDIQVGAS